MRGARAGRVVLVLALSFAALLLWYIDWEEPNAFESAGANSPGGESEVLSRPQMRPAQRSEPELAREAVSGSEPETGLPLPQPATGSPHHHAGVAVVGRVSGFRPTSSEDVHLRVDWFAKSATGAVGGELDPGGAFEVSIPVEIGDLMVVDVQAEVEGHIATRTIQVRNPLASEIDVGLLSLSPARPLTLQVVDGDGTPIVDLPVFFTEPSSASSSRARRLVTDDTGHVTLVGAQRSIGAFAMGEPSFSETFSVPMQGAYHQVVATSPQVAVLRLVRSDTHEPIEGLRAEVVVSQSFRSDGTDDAVLLAQLHSESDWVSGGDGVIRLAVPRGMDGPFSVNLVHPAGGVVGSVLASTGAGEELVLIDAQRLQSRDFRVVSHGAQLPAVGEIFRSRDRDDLYLEVIEGGRVRLAPGLRVVQPERLYSRESVVVICEGGPADEDAHLYPASSRKLRLVDQRGQAVSGLLVKLRRGRRAVDRLSQTDFEGVLRTAPVANADSISVLHYFEGQRTYGEALVALPHSPSGSPVRVQVGVSECWLEPVGPLFDPRAVSILGAQAEWVAEESAFLCRVSHELGAGVELTVRMPGCADQSVTWATHGERLEVEFYDSSVLRIASPREATGKEAYLLEVGRSGSWRTSSLGSVEAGAGGQAGIIEFSRVPIGVYRVVDLATGLASLPVSVEAGGVEVEAVWPSDGRAQVGLRLVGFESRVKADIEFEGGLIVRDLELEPSRLTYIGAPSVRNILARAVTQSGTSRWFSVGDALEIGVVDIGPDLFTSEK